LRDELQTEETRVNFRVNPVDFTRDRVLTLPIVALSILRGHKVSQQNALNKIFRELDQLEAVPTASAYCQARQKLKPELFARLNQIVVEDFYRLYGADGAVKRWRGHRLLGSDGTKINIPDTPSLRAAFTVHSNQHEEFVQATAVVLHDLLNDIGLQASLGPVSGEKRPLLEQLWEATEESDVLVLDRNFGDYSIVAWAVVSNRDVIIRCRRQSFSVVEEFWQSDKLEAIVTLNVSQSAETQRYVRAHSLPESVPVRLLKFTLPTGETEVLLTTLCDRRQYPRKEFYTVYGWRWGDETYYDRIKNIFEVERFSGESEQIIRQDFFGVIFLSTLESVLTKSAQAVLIERDQAREPETQAKVNRAVSYVSLVDEAVGLLLDERVHPEDALDRLRQLFQKNPTRHRAGRKNERLKLKHSRKLRYHRYKKRLLA
jgi:Transposase DDE domain